MKAGISTASFYPTELEKTFRFLAENGITLAEIFVNTDCELREPYIGEMLAIQKEYGVTVSSVHPYTGGIEPMYFSPYERRVGDTIDYFRHFFEYMNRLGAEYFIFHGSKYEHPCPEELYFERYLKLYEAGREYGITVTQENVSRCASRSLDFLVNMKRALGDRAKFTLDIKQARRSEAKPEDIISALGESIVHLHYSDAGEKGDCLLFGGGEADNKAVFNALKEAGYKGNTVIEVYNNGCYGKREELIENCRALQKFLDENAF